MTSFSVIPDFTSEACPRSIHTIGVVDLSTGALSWMRTAPGAIPSTYAKTALILASISNSGRTKKLKISWPKNPDHCHGFRTDARSFHFSSLFNDDSAHRRHWLNSARMPPRKARKKDKNACCYFFVIALKISRTPPNRIVSGVTRIKKTSVLLTRPGM